MDWQARSMVMAAIWLALVMCTEARAAEIEPRPGPAVAAGGAIVLGADLSALDQLENSGAVFLAQGNRNDALQILSASGISAVRLRIWHTPTDGWNSLARTVRMARRARALGLDLWLDLHLSDNWADPGQQEKPAAWQDLSSAALKDSVRAYTAAVMTALCRAGVQPGVVQIGNEITAGILWDEGRVGGAFDQPQNWRALADLLNAAIEGIAATSPPAQRPRIMVHIDRGGDPAGAQWFYDGLLRAGVDFDLIGLSYFPWWQGTLTDLAQTMSVLAIRYRKPIVVVETAYPWTLSWFDAVGNIVGNEDQLHPGFAASPAGQRAFLRALIDTVLGTPGGLGAGVFYWAPERIALPQLGSDWENLALFDQGGGLLPAAEVFREYGQEAPERR